MRCKRKHELLVRFIEQRLPRLAVQAERTPYLTRPGSESRNQLLVATQLHVLVPAPAPRWVALGCFVQRADTQGRTRDVDELVHVVAVVLVDQPLGRELPQAVVEVTCDQQGGWVERVPAGRPVVRDADPQDVGRLLPEAHQVTRPPANLADPLESSFPPPRRHDIPTT